MKILILGGSGLLGTSIVKFYKNKNIECIMHGKNNSQHINFDIFNEELLKKNIIFYNPTLIINLIGLTNISICEENYSLALKINCKTVSIINKILKSINKKIHLIHVSTDHLYDDTKINNIENKSNPINNYAKTKLLGELEIDYEYSSIIRTNFIGRSFCKKNSLSDWIIESLKNKIKIEVYEDILFNPIHTSTLADHFLHIYKNGIFGKFNVGSKGYISKSEFAKKLAISFNLSTDLLKLIKYDNNLNSVERPKNMIMNTDKYEKNSNLSLPGINGEIIKNINDYIND